MSTAECTPSPALQERVLTSKQRQRIHQRRLKIGGYAGGALLLAAIAAVAVAAARENTVARVKVLEAAKAAQQSQVAAELADDTAPAAATATVAPATTTAVPVATGKVELPPRLAKLVSERMSTVDRERFLADWSGMSADKRSKYLSALGLEPAPQAE